MLVLDKITKSYLTVCKQMIGVSLKDVTDKVFVKELMNHLHSPIYTHTHTHTYIYIERERERERGFGIK